MAKATHQLKTPQDQKPKCTVQWVILLMALLDVAIFTLLTLRKNEIDLSVFNHSSQTKSIFPSSTTANHIFRITVVAACP